MFVGGDAEENELQFKMSRLLASLNAPPAPREEQSVSAGPPGAEDDGQRPQGVEVTVQVEQPELAGPVGAEGNGPQPEGVEVKETI